MDNVQVVMETHRVLQGVFESSVASTVLWVCAALFFLLCPLYSQRKVCAARIRERRWNVDLPPAPVDPVWLQTALERSRHRRENGQQSSLSASEEEEIRQLFLVEQLSQYTLTISPKDIKMRDDLESDDDSANSVKQDVEVADIESPPSQSSSSSLLDDQAENDDSSVEQDIAVDLDESPKIVSVPIAGESVLPMDRVHKKREVANGCAICLCEFDAMDQVTWAANTDCCHVFHSDCILQYMLSLGRREQKRRRRHPDRSTGDPLKDVITFPMLCPCCRQQFIEIPPEVPCLTTDSTLVASSNSLEESQSSVVAVAPGDETEHSDGEAVVPQTPSLTPDSTLVASLDSAEEYQTSVGAVSPGDETESSDGEAVVPQTEASISNQEAQAETPRGEESNISATLASNV